MSSSSLVISDTSSLILLNKIGETELLRQSFDQVYATSIVVLEFGTLLPAWITIRDATDKISQARLEAIMDAGEASVLALAAEISDCYVLVDDNKARRTLTPFDKSM